MAVDVSAEIWKPIKGFEGYYEISTHGRVRSLNRYVNYRNGNKRLIKGDLKKTPTNSHGYCIATLHKDGTQKSYSVHQLMAVTFLNHHPDGCNLVVDHIDNNRTNNDVNNLQVITHRTNTTKDRKNGSSIYAGVNWCHRNGGRWIARICLPHKRKYLGAFKCELKAHLAYQNALKELC